MTIGIKKILTGANFFSCQIQKKRLNNPQTNKDDKPSATTV
jgi:hypothetical protein